MKRIFRISMITGALFLIVGVIITISAVAMGANQESVWGKLDFVFDDSGKEDINESYSEVTSLNFSIAASSVKVKIGETFSIKGYRTGSDFKSTVKNGKWIIETPKKNFSFFKFLRGNIASSIIITIPNSAVLEKVEIDIGAGNFEVEYLNSLDTDIDIGAGKISIKELVSEDLDLTCGAGKADIYADIQKKGKIKCGVGELGLTVKGSKSDFDISIDSALGDVTIDSENYSGVISKDITGNDASKKISVSCAVGSTKIKFE